MTWNPISDARANAKTVDREGYVAQHPEPVLVRREVIDGDLHFADPHVHTPGLRPGGTLLHVPRRTARDRLTGPPRPGRTVHPREQWTAIVGQVSLGRDRGCTVIVDDHTVSTRHATVTAIDGTDRCWIADHGSRNGTAHNGQRIEPEVPVQLMSGDEICLGREVFVYLSAAEWHAYLTQTL